MRRTGGCLPATAFRSAALAGIVLSMGLLTDISEAATGMVLGLGNNRSEHSVTGTCVAFRSSHVALTAAHCVPEDERDLWLAFPGTVDASPVVRVEKHPKADVAALFMAPHARRQVTITGVEEEVVSSRRETHLWNLADDFTVGEELVAFGFPVEGPWVGSELPVARVFRGYFQRFFLFRSPGGFTYLAGEMSIPAPGGLSGGPVFRPSEPGLLAGIVTSNLETYAVLDFIEETSRDGTMTLVKNRRVVSYGLVLILQNVEDWLDETVPIHL